MDILRDKLEPALQECLLHQRRLQAEIVQLNLRRLAQHVPHLEAALMQLQNQAVHRGAQIT